MVAGDGMRVGLRRAGASQQRYPDRIFPGSPMSDSSRPCLTRNRKSKTRPNRGRRGDSWGTSTLCTNGGPRPPQLTDAARRLNPEEFRWVYFLARSLERTDVGAAATAYSQALELDPSYLSARDAYARALRELGRAVDAREVLEVTLELNPGNARAELALGELDLQDQAFETARENLERALELDPQRIETHRALAQVYLVLGDREAANRHAQASQEDRPERILPDPVFDEVGAAGVTRYWLTVRANRYLASNQPERALEEFARAASDDEPNPMFWYNYGNALLRTGRYDEAVSTYERAVGLIDDASPVVRRDQEARFYSNLGLASANAGLLESAEENLLRALELSPSSDSEINNLRRPVPRPGSAGRRHSAAGRKRLNRNERKVPGDARSSGS